MYKEFFGLKEPPFNLTPDPRFLYMSQHHREALASLVYGIKEQKGFIVVTGEIGAGKTTLCRGFLRELDEEATNVALILNSFLSDLELIQTINDDLGIESNSNSKKELISTLNQYLLEQNDEGKTTIVIVDEAQNLGTNVLEQLRMLSNLETETRKLLQVVLIGQPELADILNQPRLEQLNQRVTVRCHIGPLKRDEIYHYIRHRLHIAGATINISLTQPAINRIHHFSGGVPRKINLLMDRALLAAYVAGQFSIDARIVAEATNELRNKGSRGIGRGIIGSAARWSLSAKILAGIVVLTWIALLAVFVPIAMKSWKDPEQASLNTTPTPTPTPTPTATPEPMQPAVPATIVGPGLDDLPDVAAVAPEEDWIYDEQGLTRVRDAELARPAALLTLAGLWRRTLPLERLRELPKSDILSLNLLNILRMPRVDLAAIEATPESLSALEALDLPLMLELNGKRGRLAPAVVMLGADGSSVLLADPRLGVVSLRRDVLENLIRRITMLFEDPDQISGLALDAEGEPVLALRNFLASAGQPTTGVQNPERFGPALENALKKFQRAHNIEPTGHVDGLTAAAIATQRAVYRPRLRRGSLSGQEYIKGN